MKIGPEMMYKIKRNKDDASKAEVTGLKMLIQVTKNMLTIKG